MFRYLCGCASTTILRYAAQRVGLVPGGPKPAQNPTQIKLFTPIVLLIYIVVYIYDIYRRLVVCHSVAIQRRRARQLMLGLRWALPVLVSCGTVPPERSILQNLLLLITFLI